MSDWKDHGRKESRKQPKRPRMNDGSWCKAEKMTRRNTNSPRIQLTIYLDIRELSLTAWPYTPSKHCKLVRAWTEWLSAHAYGIHERVKEKLAFSPGLRRALQSGSLDEVNKVLGKMSVEEAEEIVGHLSEVCILKSQWTKSILTNH